MSIKQVIELLSGGEARSLRSLGGVSSNQTPRDKVRKDMDLQSGAESAESESRPSHARPRACTRTRARGAELGAADSADSRDSAPAPDAVTLLKNCRCMDCRRFYKGVDGQFYCESYIGGTRIEWATGRRYCDPPPDAWHYCADYHGPQISKDVWAWPRRPHAEVAGVAGPSEPPAEDNRGGNGHETGLFRSPARTQGKEA